MKPSYELLEGSDLNMSFNRINTVFILELLLFLVFPAITYAYDSDYMQKRNKMIDQDLNYWEREMKKREVPKEVMSKERAEKRVTKQNFASAKAKN